MPKSQSSQSNHRYFSMIPHLVVDAGLSLRAFRLYVQVKRRAGDVPDGVCYESTRNLAKSCGMSKTAVAKAKDELLLANLITITNMPGHHGGRQYHAIKLVDLWDENEKKYSPGEHDNRQEYVPQGTTLGLGKHSQGTTLGLASPNIVLKEEPYKNIPARKRKKTAGAALNNPSIETSYEVSQDGLNEKISPLPTDWKDLPENWRSLPAIAAIQEVTGNYPPKNLAIRCIELLGEDPDIQRMQYTFDSWTAEGHAPTNLAGWLFDWYATDMHYMDPARKVLKQDSRFAELDV